MSQPRPPLLREVEGGVLVAVNVLPGAKRNAHLLDATGLKIRLAAPAVDGKANEALVSYLSQLLEIPRSRIKIVKGLTDRHKSILVAMSRAQLETKPLFFRD